MAALRTHGRRQRYNVFPSGVASSSSSSLAQLNRTWVSRIARAGGGEEISAAAKESTLSSNINLSDVTKNASVEGIEGEGKLDV